MNRGTLRGFFPGDLKEFSRMLVVGQYTQPVTLGPLSGVVNIFGTIATGFTLVSGTQPPGITFTLQNNQIVASGSSSGGGSYQWTWLIKGIDGQSTRYNCTSALPAPAYDTWDPGHTSVNVTLSSGNSVATDNANSNWDIARGQTGKNTGKWRVKFTITTISGGGTPNFSGSFGLAPSSVVLDNQYLGQGGGSIGFYLKYSGGTEKIISNVATAMSLTQCSAGDTGDLWVDFDAGKVWAGKNGTANGTGDPVAGTNPDATFTANTTLYLATSNISFSAIKLEQGASATTGYNQGWY
jgi:hypothetical protein